MIRLTPAVVCAAGLLCAGPALAEEYRRIELANGRTVVGEVVQSTPEALVIALQQGTMSIPYTNVQGLESITADDFHVQPEWKALILPFAPTNSTDDAAVALRDQSRLLLHEAVAHQRGLEIVDRADKSRAMNKGEAGALEKCGGDLECALPYAQKIGADLVLYGVVERHEDALDLLRVQVTAFWSEGGSQSNAILIPGDGPLDQQMRHSVFTLLQLVPEPEAVSDFVDVRAKRPPTDTDRAKRLAWLPVPGGPSLARRDFRGFAATWAVVVPGTVTFVGLTGSSAFTPGQFALFGLGAFYGLTVTANHAFGLREIQPSLK